jgi:hypothetical protein
MSQPVKLSDALVLNARLAGEAAERSIAGQVEFWARLGRSVELLLEGRQLLALRRSADAHPLSEALASVDTPAGRKRLADVLAGKPYPHFTSAPGQPGLLLRTDADGTETVGRFVNRVFEPVGVKKRVSSGIERGTMRQNQQKRSSSQSAAKGRPVRIKATSAPEARERDAWS